MKSSLMRPALALALALALASCGGKAGFTIGGTVYGQKYDGLVLTTNGMDVTVNAPLAPATSMTYSFPNELQYGDVYEITVKTQPPHQTCVPYGRTWTDTAGHLSVINAVFNCSLNSHTIGGTVSGLTADGLVLANGSTGGTVSVPKNATAFSFGLPVLYGVSYGVTVQAQPTGLQCSVSPNGTGVMGDANVTTIGVACVPKS